MLKPFGFSVVVSDATLVRVTIVESPIHMVTLTTLAVQIPISAYHHSGMVWYQNTVYEM